MKRILIIVISALIWNGCKKNNEMPADCSGPAKSYIANIKPILVASCTNGSGCHGAGSNSGPGPLIIYSQVFDARNEIRPAVASGHMPMNSTLSTADKNAILCWIDNGAPED